MGTQKDLDVDFGAINEQNIEQVSYLTLPCVYIAYVCAGIVHFQRYLRF